MDEVVWTLRMARERKKGCVLLIGAGCSVTAGIPAASGIVALIRDQYRPFYERAADKTYPLLMAELSAGERRDLIARYVDEARVNWAHVCIAQLMKKGFVDRILTTNFDPLVIRACALVGHFPAVYDFAASQIFSAGDIPHDAVVYLHGQRSGFVLLNTRQEVEHHSELLKPVFDEAGQGRVWIVVGYSGESDPVFERLAESRRFDNRLYWIGYGDGEPPRHVSERLLTGGKDAFYVSGFDADSFFLRLAQELQCFPPDFIGKPFSYLSQLMDTLTTSEDTQQSSRRGREFMSRARKMIRDAVEQYETGEAAETERLQEDLLLAGKFEEVAQMGPEEAEPTPELAWARVLEGNRLGDEAIAASRADADRLFAAAYGEYEAALEVKPDMDGALGDWVITALGNWAISLADQAKTKEGAEADGLFAAAYEKYEAAHELSPDNTDTLRYWADALGDQAKMKEGAEADRLFAAAYGKYKAALEVKPDKDDALGDWVITARPDDPDTIGNWASTLADHARAKHGDEADRLFAAAYEKYEAALALRPDDPDTIGNWALTLADHARTKQGDEANRLFAAAYEKYEAAVALRPDDAETLSNWGIALLDQGRTKLGDEALQLFREADRRFHSAEASRPGSAAYNLACSSALQGNADEARLWLQTSKALGVLPTAEELERDTDLDSIRDEDWFRDLAAGL
ncbi:MAG: hypothetical protein A2Y55_12860 [Actinobacteria bacterium RBG_16_68_12]|nr:MAG: hypothetical protein A2Y55_12860 [Actinobacteria bacterium RBG_16_68_12]